MSTILTFSSPHVYVYPQSSTFVAIKHIYLPIYALMYYLLEFCSTPGRKSEHTVTTDIGREICRSAPL